MSPVQIKDAMKVEIVDKPDPIPTVIRNGQKMRVCSQGSEYYAPMDIFLTEEDFRSLRRKETIQVIMQNGKEVWLRFLPT